MSIGHLLEMGMARTRSRRSFSWDSTRSSSSVGVGEGFVIDAYCE